MLQNKLFSIFLFRISLGMCLAFTNVSICSDMPSDENTLTMWENINSQIKKHPVATTVTPSAALLAIMLYWKPTYITTPLNKFANGATGTKSQCCIVGMAVLFGAYRWYGDSSDRKEKNQYYSSAAGLFTIFGVTQLTKNLNFSPSVQLIAATASGAGAYFATNYYLQKNLGKNLLSLAHNFIHKK